MKKYLANTAISISALLQNGKSIRISFDTLSDGRSVFYTNDKKIQYALEHHYKYGKLFRLLRESNAPTDSRETNSQQDNNETTIDAEMKIVTVSDMDSAKDYLAEHFDIVRTKLKKKEIIEATAAAHGIKFKYL